MSCVVTRFLSILYRYPHYFFGRETACHQSNGRSSSGHAHTPFPIVESVVHSFIETAAVSFFHSSGVSCELFTSDRCHISTLDVDFNKSGRILYTRAICYSFSITTYLRIHICFAKHQKGELLAVNINLQKLNLYLLN